MVKTGDGEWLPAALRLEGLLVGSPKAAHDKLYKDEQDSRNLRHQTLRRQVRAAAYVRSIAKSIGLDIADVRAAVVSIEALMRLEKRDGRLATDIRDRVFKGDITQRALLEMLKMPGRAVATTQHDWHGFVAALNDHLFEGLALSIGRSRAASFSATAREIKVDLEVATSKSTTVAVFLSPKCAFSEFYGRSFDDQIPRLFMALFFFGRIIFASAIDEELDTVERLRQRASLTVDRMETFDLRIAFESFRIR